MVPYAGTVGGPAISLSLGHSRKPNRFVLLFFAALAFACCATAGTPRLTSPEQMAWSTYAVATEKGLGTGLIVNCKDANSPTGVSPVLVTCAHVLSVAPRGPFYIIIRLGVNGGNPDTAVLKIDIPPDCNKPFIKHPKYDIAVMKIDVPPEMAHLISFPSFVEERSLGRAAPHVGEEIFVLGFPKVFPGTEGAFPVFRGGRIASYAAGSRENWDKYLIHSNVYPGDSGAPVFAVTGRGGPTLLGMVTERIGPKTGDVPLAVAIDSRVVGETLALLHAPPIPGNINLSNKRFASGSKGTPSVKVIGPASLLTRVLHARAP